MNRTFIFFKPIVIKMCWISDKCVWMINKTIIQMKSTISDTLLAVYVKQCALVAISNKRLINIYTWNQT